LFLYAVAFSFAYVSLSAGTGALILFGSVQTTMLAAALRSGERPHVLEWSGLFVALAGLVCLVFPGLSAPSPISSMLMIVAGISWGFYSLRGRGVADPLADTAGNFVYAVPLAVLVNVIMFRQLHISLTGWGWLSYRVRWLRVWGTSSGTRPARFDGHTSGDGAVGRARHSGSGRRSAFVRRHLAASASGGHHDSGGHRVGAFGPKRCEAGAGALRRKCVLPEAARYKDDCFVCLRDNSKSASA
jgi:hypothetical protein